MRNKADQIAQKVRKLILPIMDEADFELVDIAYLSERGRWVLRIYVDKTDGITLNDCAWVSREIGDLIDVKDICPNPYVLEVSSPGLNRPLKTEADLLRVLGKKVKIKMVFPVKGRQNYTGYLQEFQGGRLLVDIGEDRVALPWKDVKKANLVYEFQDGKC